MFGRPIELFEIFGFKVRIDLSWFVIAALVTWYFSVHAFPAQLPGRFVCVYCLRRFELVSQCPNCGEHQTIARMSKTEDMQCQHCGHSMLRSI